MKIIMKQYRFFLAMLALVSAQAAYANNLEYMINPPKERTAEQIQAEIDKKHAEIAQDKKDIAKLSKERDAKLVEMKPAAGGAKTQPHYDNYLGHR